MIRSLKKYLGVSERVALALFVGIVGVPMASTAFLQPKALHDDNRTSFVDIQRSAREGRAIQREKRRLYWQAMEENQRRRRIGIDAQKPEYNTWSTVEALLSASSSSSSEVLHAAPATDSHTSTVDGLTRREKSILRRYTRVKSCPASMKRLGNGLYEMCKKIVGDNVKAALPVGFINDNVALHAKNRSVTPSFKLRMQMMKEARDRSNRRADGR